MVERIGHKVEFALNGYVALELANKLRPEFVFLDLVMPVVAGIHIVAATASASEQHREHSRGTRA